MHNKIRGRSEHAIATAHKNAENCLNRKFHYIIYNNSFYLGDKLFSADRRDNQQLLTYRSGGKSCW